MTRQAFSAVPLTLRELIQKNETYIIPGYQRPYMWGERQVSMLLRDLVDFFTASGTNQERYSLGTIVCDGREGVYEILDGQQRLTTMDLILSEVENSCTGRASPRLIAAYRYLNGQANAEKTQLPHCSTQRNIIALKLEPLKTADKLEAFRTFMLDRVVLRRVIIPLSGEIAYEPQWMFEIVNLRGQKLTALDVIKSRFLAALDESTAFDRALFDRFWCAAEENLASRKVDSFRIQEKVLKELHDPDHSSLAKTFGAIMAEEDASAQSAQEAGGIGSREIVSKEEGDAPSEHSYESPVDSVNALSIAWELFKFLAGDGKPDALSEVGLIDKFDGLVRNEIALKDGADKNVWRLMTIYRVVLQTALWWGPYRNPESGEVVFTAPADKNGFHRLGELALSFMANNGYRTDAQYWLLAASAVALGSVAQTFENLPVDAEAFNSFPIPNFNALETETYEALLYLGFAATTRGMNDGTSLVLEYVAQPREARRIALTAVRNEAAKRCPGSATEEGKEEEQEENHDGWCYGAGLSQWQLYFVDYLLLADDQREYSTLRSAMTPDDSMPADLRTALSTDFAWDIFQNEKRYEMRTVSRGAVEHWLAQNNAADDADWERRNGFGNLALIDPSSNSSLGKLNALDKAVAVRKMANPARKLWWLAVFTLGLNGRDLFTSEWVEPLSRVWGRFLGEFPLPEE